MESVGQCLIDLGKNLDLDEADQLDLNLDKQTAIMLQEKELQDTLSLLNFKKLLENATQWTEEIHEKIFQDFINLLTDGQYNHFLNLFNEFLKFIETKENSLDQSFHVISALGYVMRGNSLQAAVELDKVDDMNDTKKTEFLKELADSLLGISNKGSIIEPFKIDYQTTVHLVRRIVAVIPIVEVQLGVAENLQTFIQNSKKSSQASTS